MKSLTIHNPGEFGRVAVLMGGESAEREVSLRSGTAVYEALQRQQIESVAIDIEDNAIQKLSTEKIDRAFNIMHGRGGEDGVIQAVLESMHIPYTGSGVMSSALTLDKLRTKLCWQGYGLMTPAWFVLKTRDDIDPCIETLGFPVIVKPAQEGSSIGMSKAGNREELIKAMNLAARYQCDVFAEAWINGTEYTVAVLEGEALPVIRLQTPNLFYDFAAKYQSETTQYHCPAGLSQRQEMQLQKLAVAASDVVGVTGWGRVDVLVNEAGQRQLIEVNTVPGMTDHSLVPMAAKAAGIEFDELVWRILETSMKNA